MTDFAAAARWGACLAKPYAADVFRVLAIYREVSASEAAARLSLHIQTVQAFLETLADLEVVERRRTTGRTRPHVRYRLKANRMAIELDFGAMARSATEPARLTRLVRERVDSDARFVRTRGRPSVSEVVLWEGSGRERIERRVRLTAAQGAVLSLLPFPASAPRAVEELIREAGVDPGRAGEVADMFDQLQALGVVEAMPPADVRPAAGSLSS